METAKGRPMNVLTGCPPVGKSSYGVDFLRRISDQAIPAIGSPEWHSATHTQRLRWAYQIAADKMRSDAKALDAIRERVTDDWDEATTSLLIDYLLPLAAKKP